MLIDCHAHLASSRFDEDRDEVRARAEEVGVAAVLVVGEDQADNRRVLSTVDNSPPGGCRLLPCFGLHPDRFADDRPLPTAQELDQVESQIRQNAHRLMAVGEVGLDYWYTKDPERRAAQITFLERMAALGEELDLPLNVHSRSAGHYALDALLQAGASRVLMHAFDGKASHAHRAAENGFLFSIPPSLVRSEQKQKLVAKLPLESLALESDSPVLGPVRKERNEPANLILTAEAISKAHAVSMERVAETTTANALRLFNKVGAAL